MQNFLPSCWRMLSKLLYKGFKSRHPMLECFPFSPPCVRARFHGRLELDMRVQPALQHALLEYRLCRDWSRTGFLFLLIQSRACTRIRSLLFCSARPSALDSLQFKHPRETHSYSLGTQHGRHGGKPWCIQCFSCAL
jgi:hypothetical protein